MARAARSKPKKIRPEAPDVPPSRQPAPASVESDTTWDGLLVGPGVDVPDHVADLALQECRLEGVDLSGRRFGGLRCRDTEFVHCDLSGAVLEDAGFTRVTFTDCRLTGVGLAGASLTDVHIRDCRADMADLRMARGKFLLVEDTGLQGADFYRFSGSGCGLVGCDLTGANFADAELADVYLHRSTLDDVRGAFSLRGSRISADQQVPLGGALLAALGIQVTDPPV
ncbi:pentapeptide repeat-containing protein [Pseudonocardia humida]|uniref:Pentapeptide repeat-containing protein n=1 Tax=Pseudonocardia humida TaxID=2800819 RepID=A0ABT0ZVC5_9PSEU|nr:pentapeptide repeat-containing protein [Pseudonocardia humida]MCO1654671.1 pentapeptide repeat-containing protein [Pseudonocardia humida]